MAFEAAAAGSARPRATSPAIAVVIPSFRASATIGGVLRLIGPAVRSIYVVDDGCPEASGEAALRDCADARLIVLHNARNLGVGAAMKHGYARALADGADIVVKLDADGQMDPAFIERLIAPIVRGNADYAKGNRFAPPAQMPPGSCPRALDAMPPARWLANRGLALIHRSVTGYGHVADPANGFTAIDAGVLRRIGIERLADCFFFETDMLCRLGLADAVVVEVPLPACYPGSGSSLSVIRVAPRFARLIVSRWFERRRTRRGPGRRGTVSIEPLWRRTRPR